MSALTAEERRVLEVLEPRSGGSWFREPSEKEAILSLCANTLVCDPHETGTAMFTRITEEGSAALAAS